MSVPLAGQRVKAVDLSGIFQTGVDGWSTFTPTLTQSATVTKTVVHAQYIKIGRLVIANYYLSVTGTGTAANVALVGLPVAAATAGLASIGAGMIFDSSAGLFYNGTAIVNDANTFKLAGFNIANYLGAAGMAAALAVNDIVSASIMYQSAS